MKITHSKLILTHTGSEIPDYTEVCIKQVQKTNPKCEITFIAEEKHWWKFSNKFNIKNVKLCPISELTDNVLLREFREVSWFKNWGKPNTHYPSPENFVHGTSERLFLLNAFVCKYKLKDFWHIENDNLIYGSFEWLYEYYLKSRENITMCYMNEKHCVCNVVHCPNYMVLNEMMYWYLYQLKLGNAALISRYTIDMVHEMTILRHYKNVNYFPSLPDENTLGDYLFDPASYGQYLAGTNNGHDPGFLDTVNHDIGRTFGVKWKGASFKKPYPYIHCMNKTYTKLFNLHMHNKHKIKEFSTI